VTEFSRAADQGATAPGRDGPAVWQSHAAYPILAVVAHVISHVSYYGVPYWAGFRPLLVAIAVAALVQLATWRLVGGHRGSFIAGIIATFVVGAIFATLALLAVAAARVALPLVRRTPPSWPSTTGGLNVLAVALVLVSLATAWTTETFMIAQPGEARADSAGTAPDMYLLMLDGYPRGDTLASWGFDNGDFERELESLGFTVSPESHSNYTKTWLSLATFADLRHIGPESFEGSIPSESIQHRRLSTIFNEGAAWDVLRRHGYEIASVETTFADLALYTADRTIGSWPLNAFETDLLRFSPLTRLGIVSDRIIEAHRARVRGQFTETTLVDGDGPTFVWSHIVSPHAPAMFDAAGGFVDHPCYPELCPFFQPQAEDTGVPERDVQDRLGAQVQYVNGLLLETVRAIQGRDADAVIVVFSDHGARHGQPGEEYFHNFFAARTPQHPGLFPDDVGMITILPLLLNAYLDADITVPDGEPQFLTIGTTLEMVPWPPGE
jgi:hypothetical protein